MLQLTFELRPKVGTRTRPSIIRLPFLGRTLDRGPTKIISTHSQWKLTASKLHFGYQWQFQFKQDENIIKYQQELERCRGRRRICRHSSHRGQLTEKVVLGTMCSEKCWMSQTQVKELTIGALQALVGDKRRRGLISDLHLAAEPSSATWCSEAKNWKLLQVGFYKKRSVFLGINLFTWIQNLFLSISLLWYSIVQPFTCLWMQN